MFPVWFCPLSASTFYEALPWFLHGPSQFVQIIIIIILLDHTINSNRAINQSINILSESFISYRTMVLFSRKQALKHDESTSSFSVSEENSSNSMNMTVRNTSNHHKNTKKNDSLDGDSMHSIGSTFSARRLKFWKRRSADSPSVASTDEGSSCDEEHALRNRVTFGPRSYAPVSYMDVQDDQDYITLKRSLYWSSADLKHMKSREQRLARHAVMFHDKNLASYLRVAYGISEDMALLEDDGMMTPERALEYFYQYNANTNNQRGHEHEDESDSTSTDSSSNDDDDDDDHSSLSSSALSKHSSSSSPSDDNDNIINLRGLERHVSHQITEHRRDVIQMVLGLQRDIQTNNATNTIKDAQKVLKRGAAQCSLPSRKFALRLGFADAAVAKQIYTNS